MINSILVIVQKYNFSDEKLMIIIKSLTKSILRRLFYKKELTIFLDHFAIW